MGPTAMSVSSLSSRRSANILVCLVQKSEQELGMQNVEDCICAVTQPHLPWEHG